MYKKKIIFIFLIILIALTLGIVTAKTNKKTIKTTLKQRVSETPRYNNVVGSITLEGKEEPITKTTNNTYYLDHNYRDEKDILGNIFMDYRNDLRDKLLLVYGHNSKDLNPLFKTLENYLDHNYYLNHKEISIKLSDKEYTYKVFSVYKTKEGDYTHTKVKFKTKEEYLEHLNYLKGNSIYDTGVNLSSSDKTIILQTCNYDPVNTFILIILKRS